MRTQAKPIRTITTASGTTRLVRAMVELPESTYDTYAEQAIARGVTIEHLMAERLVRARTQVHDAMVFTAEQKRRLDKAIGHTVSDAEGALQRLENFCQLKVEDVEVELEPRIVQRITSRAKAQRKDFAKCVRDEVVGALRRFTGIDPY